MKPGSRRQMGNMEFHAQSAPDHEDVLTLRSDACGQIFKAPLLAQDARTLSPCMLARGHSGKHENAKGVSWGTRKDARHAPTSAPPATRGRTTAVPGRTDAERKALMQRHIDQIRDQRTDRQPAAAGTPTPYEPRGPIAEAQRAVRLANSPSNDWLPSQLSVIVDKLDQAARNLAQYAEARGGMTHRTQAQQVNGLVLAARTALAPGVANMAGQREAVETLRRAVADLIEPLAEQQRFAQMEAKALADPQPVRTAPPSIPAHPWFTGHRAS
ncbi:hypothetical protein [Streptomyces scabiei]|uniref:hypothetical protein n=1 Tax=Streptomyces scabiei TaxID=1930 RepID=UPI0029AFBA1A|nr:hypothetical protein [Streptomyces scabiei]MDX3522376.1 hypothetical protein [Streptomyces scabiei]